MGGLQIPLETMPGKHKIHKIKNKPIFLRKVGGGMAELYSFL